MTALLWLPIIRVSVGSSAPARASVDDAVEVDNPLTFKWPVGRLREVVLDHVTPGPVKLAYQTAGERGEPVVFIMGYGVPGRAWAEVATLISSAHRAIWFDNRGIGLSDAPAGPYNMPQLAGDVANLIDHLDVDRVHLVGVSMGGMIAQELVK